MEQIRDKKLDSMTAYIAVYVTILVIAVLQVVYAYHRTDIGQHVIRMLSLAIVQGGLAVAFFMHVMQEKRAFLLILIPATVFVLLMMNMIWSDSFRLFHMRPFPS
jgi:cytochrome c oxidase subunit IV